MKKLLITTLILGLWVARMFGATPSFGQLGGQFGSGGGNANVLSFPGVPSGACIFSQLGYNVATGALYQCSLGSWVILATGGGSGTVTSFSAGNLSPLFTSSVATASTTPALTFGLTNAAANSWFGNATGSSAAPSYNTSALPTSVIPNPAGDVSGAYTSTNVTALDFLGTHINLGAAPTTNDVLLDNASGVITSDTGTFTENTSTHLLSFDHGFVSPTGTGAVSLQVTADSGSDDALRVNTHTPTTAFKVASAGGVFLPILATGTQQCMHLTAAGQITLAAADCGSGGGGGTPGGSSGQIQVNNAGAFAGEAGSVYVNNMTCDGHTDDRAALQTALSNAAYGATIIIPNTPTGCYINIQQQKISTIAFSANTVTLTMAATANSAFVTNGLARITGLTSSDSANYNLFPGVWQLASVSGSTITFTLTNSTSVTTFNPSNAFLSIGVWLTQNGVSLVCGPGATNIWSASGSQGACNLFTTPSTSLSTVTSHGDIFTSSATNGPYIRGVYAVDNQGGVGVGYARTAMGGFYIQGSQTYAFDQAGAMGFTCLGNPNEQGCGAGITLDGGSPNGNYAPTQNTTSYVQYGTMVNPELIGNKYGITTRGRSSDLKVYGGVMSCLLPTALTKAVLIPNSIGWDQGYTWGKAYYSGANAANEGGGNWAYGTAVSQCQTGYALMNTSNNGIIGKAENATALGPYPDTIAGFITSTNNTSASASRIDSLELHIVGFNSGIFEDSNSQNQHFTGFEQTQCSGNIFSGTAYTSGAPNNCGGQITTIGAIGTGGSSGGSGWAVGDWFQLNGTVCVATGGPGVVSLGRVLTVSTGAVTAVALMTRGSEYAACTGTAETAAALGASTGTGLSINITAVGTSGTNQGISTTVLASNGVVTGDFSFTGSMLQDSGVANDTVAWFPTLDSNSTPANITAATGSSLVQPPSDVVPLTVKCFATGVSDCLDVYNASNVKAVWVDSSGNWHNIGNFYGLGSTGQVAPASHFVDYGSVLSGTNNNGGVFTFQSGDGSFNTSILAPGLTASGDLCVTSTYAPSGDCGFGVSGVNVIPQFVGASGATVGHGLVIHTTQPFTVEDLGAPPMGNAIPTTVSGATSGGIPCFTSTTSMGTSVLLGTNNIVVGGGAGACPTASADFSIGALTAHTLSAATGSAVIDFSASTTPMKVPTVSAATTTADSQFTFDSAASVKNYHLFANGADAIIATVPLSTAVNGHCVKWVVGASGNVQVGDTGSACGSGGSTTLSAISAATTTNTILNANNGAQLWEWAQTTASQTAFELADSAAATGTGDLLFVLATAANSTEVPLTITQGAISNTTTVPALNITDTWNNSGLVGEGIQLTITNTSSSTSSTLLNLLTGATSQFSVSVAGVTTANSTSVATNFKAGSGTASFEANSNSTSLVFQGGQDATSTGVVGGATFRGANQTGAGGSGSGGGPALLVGGANSATNTASQAGSVGIQAGVSNGASPNTGNQGSLSFLDSYAQGGTVSLWTLECFSGTSVKTVVDCSTASPTNIAGVAQSLKATTVAATVAGIGSDVPVNLTSAGTVNDTVCTGTTAGKLTDSGGTAPCTTGITVGTIVSTTNPTGGWQAADGSTATLSTTLALVHITKLSATGNGDLSGPITVANGGTGDTSVTAYAPILGGTTSTGAFQSAIAGTSGQVFVSQGSATKPTYIDLPAVDDVPAANCNNTTAGAGWSIGSGGTVTCRAGTNNLGGYVAITDTSSTFAQFAVQIPEDWDTATNPYIRFHLAYPGTDGASAHTIIPQIKVSCEKGDGSTGDDVAFNAAHSSSTITLSSATANLFFATSNVQTNSTDMTGCVAGSMMIVQVGRATDTATSAVNFYSATVTFPRLIVVQAN